MRRFFLVFVVAIPLPLQAGPGDKLCVVGEFAKEGVTVKEAPTPDSEIVMTIGAGRVVIEFGRENNWVFVGVDRGGGRSGYLPAETLSEVDLDGLPCGS